MINFYLAPLAGDGSSRAGARRPAGIPAGRWSLKDFGNEVKIGLVASDICPVGSDALPLAGWSARQRSDITAYLAAAGVESKWVVGAADRREGLHRLAGLTQAYQAGRDDPAIWLGRPVYFGLTTLRPLDKSAYLYEQAQLRQRMIEPLRVRWTPRVSWRDWLRSINPLWLPFAALPATDVFTAANGTALTTYNTNWSYLGSSSFEIQSNTVTPSASPSVDMCARWNADTFNDNQYSQATIPSVSNNVWVGVAVRAASGANSFYGYSSDSENSKALFKVVSASYTELAADINNELAGGETLRLEAEGTTIRPKLNGSADPHLAAQTDSSLPGGYAGITGWGDSDLAQIDNWEGGNLGAAAGQPTMVRWGGIPGMTLTGRGRW